MSQPARKAVQLAVRLNPSMASTLHDILLEMPRCVRRKPGDRFGPPALMLMMPGERLGRAGTVEVFVPRGLTQVEAALCEGWNQEWLDRRFSREEFRRAIADDLYDHLASNPAEAHVAVVPPSSAPTGYGVVYRADRTP